MLPLLCAGNTWQGLPRHVLCKATPSQVPSTKVTSCMPQAWDRMGPCDPLVSSEPVVRIEVSIAKETSRSLGTKECVQGWFRNSHCLIFCLKFWTMSEENMLHVEFFIYTAYQQPSSASSSSLHRFIFFRIILR